MLMCINVLCPSAPLPVEMDPCEPQISPGLLGETLFTSVVSGVDSCEQTAFSFSGSYSFSHQPDLNWSKARECTTIKR